MCQDAISKGTKNLEGVSNAELGVVTVLFPFPSLCPLDVARLEKKYRRRPYAQAAIAGVGAGELAAGFEGARPLLPASLPLGLLLPLTRFSSFELGVPEESLSLTTAFLGARHEGRSQTTPVKLLTKKPLFSHLRQGVPVRSRARRPALMAP